jgi:hypothetical protein
VTAVRCPADTRCQTVQRIWEGSVAFREVGVHEIKEVLRLWLRGEGLRSIARLARVDRKTARRYVEAAAGCGLDRAGGEAQLGDELLSAVAEQVRPHRSGGRGDSWALLAAHHARLKELLGDGLTVVRAGELLAREGVVVPLRTLHRYALEVEQLAEADASAAQQDQPDAGERVGQPADGGHQVPVGVGWQGTGQRLVQPGDVGGE